MTYQKAHKRDRTNIAMSDKAYDMQWKGTWDQLRGKALRLWGELTDDDLDVMQGHFEELIGNIERSTGEALEDIRQKLFEE